MPWRKPLIALGLPLAVLSCSPAEPSAAPAQKANTTANSDAAPSSVSTVPTKAKIKVFRDWTAVCDNGLTCVAYGKDEQAMGFVYLRLQAGASARPGLEVGGLANEPQASPLEARLDGQKLSGYTPPAQADENAILSFPTASPELLKSLSQGRRLTLGSGDQSLNFSLSGLAAAMLWIDEVQGRLDTPTALIRRGTQPASRVPPAPPLPRVTAAPKVDQANLPTTTLPAAIARMPEIMACADVAGSAMRFRVNLSHEVYRLNATTLLWSIPCGAGAYNYASVYFTSRPDGTQAEQLNLQTTTGRENMLINSDYDPDSRILTSDYNGRGVGDCGQNLTWVWTNEGFVLSEEQEMSDCTGLPADLWPYLWRTSGWSTSPH